MRNPSRQTTWHLFLLAIGIARAFLGWRFPGFLTGDDVEILQEAFRRVGVLLYEPWEIRNTLISDVFVAPWVALAQLVGVQDRWSLCWIATLPFVLASLLNIEMLRRIVLRVAGNELTAYIAAGFYALHWIPFGYAGTVYPRTAATTFVLLATLVILEGLRFGRGVLAGGLVSVAFAFRYSEAIFLAPLLCLVALSPEEPSAAGKRPRTAAGVLLGFGAGTLLFVGGYDWITWGRPFSSLIAFADYTLIERQASSLVRDQPWYWYFWRSPRWVDPLALAFAFFAARKARNLSIALFVLIPVVLLSLIHHKELRYLQGVIPFTCALVGLGALVVQRRLGFRLVAAALALSALYSLSQLRFLQKKSMAAVAAARHLAHDPSIRSLAAPQLWAFGDRIFLGDRIQLQAVSHPLRIEMLKDEIAGSDAVALYSRPLRENPDAQDLVRSAGFCERQTFRMNRSEDVTVFYRCMVQAESTTRQSNRGPAPLSPVP